MLARDTQLVLIKPRAIRYSKLASVRARAVNFLSARRSIPIASRTVITKRDNDIGGNSRYLRALSEIETFPVEVISRSTDTMLVKQGLTGGKEVVCGTYRTPRARARY